ncbi:MAG: DMT family transporter [Ignavibacteriaceae bacterium]|nr:DMT family transporter [Ignavibacteriaceae bacterium]
MKNKLFLFWKPFLAVVLWGLSFIATKIALSELTPEAIILLRLLLGIALLLIIALFTKRDFSVSLKNHLSIFILALIAVFHLWIQITGLKYTSATNTGWIIGVTPVFMAALGFLLFKENITLTKISGIVIAFAGLLILMSKGDILSIGFISHKGDFLVLASAFTWSIYSIINKKISLGYSPFMTILYLFIMMAVIITPFILNSETINSVIHLSLRSWLAVIFLGVFCSGIAYVLWAQALKELEAVKVGVLLYFEPFVTVFAAWLMLNEAINLPTILGGLVITSGVILVNKKKAGS